MIDLETAIIKSLDYELHFTCPLLFLERYLRIYNLDLIKSDREAHTLSLLAHTFCRMILRTQVYLSLKPSQIAAAVLTLAVNVSTSPIAASLGITPLTDDPKLNSLFFENNINIEMAGVPQLLQKIPYPLKMWNQTVLRTTQLSMEDDIRPAYTKMLKVANELIFCGKLSQDPRLFLEPEGGPSPAVQSNK